MTRMEEEADLLGADGVVGVRLEFKNYAHRGERPRVPGHRHGGAPRAGEHYRTHDNRPFTSDLSGQDFWKLVETGYRPVSLAMGACVYHIRHMGLMQSLKTDGPQYRADDLLRGDLHGARAGAGAHASRGEERGGPASSACG